MALASGPIAGRMLGHYRIVEQIGAGGMGVVYRAHDTRLERDVALKILPPGALVDESARKRFRTEALALSRLNHPNISTVHDFDTQNGIDFVVMELIAGKPLDERIAAGVLAEKEIIQLGFQIAEGLDAAHREGVIHRDLKPANLRLTSEGRLKILDFGLAKLAMPIDFDAATASQSEDTRFAGTVPYMAPEQIRGEMLDARTDVWAAGAVLFEMATGKKPFGARGLDLTDRILHQPATAPSSVNPKISPALDAVVLKCLDKDPDNRYQSARELAVDLRRIGISGSTIQAPTARVNKRWSWKTAAVSLALGALLITTGLLLRTWRAHALTETDTIVLADFVNTTGDAVFTDTLRQGLLVQLNQSPFLNILSDDQVQATLRQMGRHSQDNLDDQLAREVCQRNHSKVYIGGSITSLGSQYVLGLKAVNCSTGDTLVQQQSQVSRKEEILQSLGKQASLLRRKLGESLVSIKKFDVPLEQATTPSLEALQAYSLGWKEWRQKGSQYGIASLKHAIDLDPDFALAYARLGAAYANLGQPGLAEENLRKAYSLRERITDRERLYIESGYYRQVTGDLERASQIFELYKSTYPQDAVPCANLGVIYGWLGKHNKSLDEFRECFRRDPDSRVSIVNLANSYVSLGEVEEARKVLAEAEGRGFHSDNLLLLSYQVAFLRHDQHEIEQIVNLASTDLRLEHTILAAQSRTEAYFGRLKEARELRQRAVELARRSDLNETASTYLAQLAVLEAEFGNSTEAQRAASESLTLFRTRDAMILAALAFARSGNPRPAEALADELAQKYPVDTLLILSGLPTIRAAIETNQNNPSRAIVILQRAFSVELGEWKLTLQPVYARGQAYLLLHRGGEAASEFQKILDHPGIVRNDPLGALAHLGMARAHVLEGDEVKARSEYEQFLTLWQAADSDIPILREAKAEYAALLK